MVPAGAAHRYHQLALPLLPVQGQKIIHHVGKAGDKPLRLLLFQYIIPYRRIQARLGTELLHIEGVRQTAYIENQVRFHGDPIFKAKADAVHRQGIAGAAEKQLGDARFQLRRGHARGVNDIIGAFFDRLKHLPLQLYRLLQRAVQIIGKRMLAARLFETVDQHRVRGIEKQDLIFPFFPL